MGDNIHQRALVRELKLRDRVLLETPWPSIYHDLVGPRLSLRRPYTSLRTQSKNSERECGLYSQLMPMGCEQLRVWYDPADIRTCGSVLAAMLLHHEVNAGTADFRLPVPSLWEVRVNQLLAEWQPQKPIMFYRPLVERTEWGGCAARNPDPVAYSALYHTIRENFFVVSIADLVPGVEWLSGIPVLADVELHYGELNFEDLAVLAKASSLVFASPGFAVILAQSVGTPVVCVFGGYENSSSFSAGAKFAPYLGIDPIKPCSCFKHDHHCQKGIDLAVAIPRLVRFTEDNCFEPEAKGIAQ